MLAGQFAAIQELHCGCTRDTGKTMRMFRVAKGEMTECWNGHGLQKTRHVRSGERRYDPQYVVIVPRFY